MFQSTKAVDCWEAPDQSQLPRILGVQRFAPPPQPGRISISGLVHK